MIIAFCGVSQFFFYSFTHAQMYLVRWEYCVSDPRKRWKDFGVCAHGNMNSNVRHQHSIFQFYIDLVQGWEIQWSRQRETVERKESGVLK